MLSELLTLGTRWSWVGGKGGVGKTTTAAALATELAGRGRRVLVLSVDPAHSLGDALGIRLGDEPAPVPGVEGLRALEVRAERERERFLARHRAALASLLERGTYLDGEDVAEMTDAAVPGVDELAAIFRLMELSGGGEEYLVVDTAPTGHTLRLLEVPRLARGWLAALEAMEEKHRAVALALAGAYRADASGLLLRELDEGLARLDALLADPAATRFLLVTTSEPVVLAETRRYQEELTRRGIGLGGIVVNRSAAESRTAAGPGMVFVPRLAGDPAGVEGLRRFAATASAAPPAELAGADTESAPVRVGAPFEPPPDRRLYLVGGKGGVGKSTTAAALAVHLADRGKRVLLLSVDPAGSLGEVLGQPVGGAPATVSGAAGLQAQQLDAAATWTEFRQRYRRETEQLFEGLLSGGLSAEADRRVLERLVDLAPSGVDELMALLEVVDRAEDRVYDALVLDTAPTGHLLRLLELPDVALEWTRTLMRLLLKYRAVVGLGSVAERLLALSRQLRALRELLRDPQRSWVLAVALPEALSVPETERLRVRLRELGMAPGALLINRLLTEGGRVSPSAGAAAAALLRGAGAPAAAAPRLEGGPVGTTALRSFVRAWRTITTD